MTNWNQTRVLVMTLSCPYTVIYPKIYEFWSFFTTKLLSTQNYRTHKLLDCVWHSYNVDKLLWKLQPRTYFSFYANLRFVQMQDVLFQATLWRKFILCSTPHNTVWAIVIVRVQWSQNLWMDSELIWIVYQGRIRTI